MRDANNLSSPTGERRTGCENVKAEKELKIEGGCADRREGTQKGLKALCCGRKSVDND